MFVRLVFLLALLLPPFRALGDDLLVNHGNGITILGTPALPANFPYFPWVNPKAPKGGEVVLGEIGTYDNFNPFILRGISAFGMDSAWVTQPGGAGSGASVGHVWESLLTGSSNEIATAYGHIAQSIDYPKDKMWIAFNMRLEAKFSDGVPVTADDVVWTFNTLLAHGRPSYKILLADVKDAVAENPHRVVFHFKSNENRELPLLVGGLPVLPKHFWEHRDFEQPVTEAPVGSGPYKVASFELGRSITYVRDPNWWARDLPTGIGTNNFDRVKIDYFRDPTVTFEAFKAGDVDIRSENISRLWATAYNFPAVQKGQVIRQEIEHHLPAGMQGLMMNTRRAVFQDRRVRAAIVQMMDFQWLNKNLMYGAYKRLESWFTNTPMASSGLPDEAELALLEPFRDKLPPEIFTTPYKLPVTDGSGNDRELLRAAYDLLKQAGYTLQGGKMVDGSGKQLSFTILLTDPATERVTLPFAERMRKLGIDAQVRAIDSAQWIKQIEAFDFDITTFVFPGSELPGGELRDIWECQSRDVQGSGNLAGACNPAIDDLVERIVKAQDRPTLYTAGRALDRVLLGNQFAVPEWYSNTFRMAWWDKFDHPDAQTREGFNFDYWWVDAAKQKTLEAARGGQ